METSERERSRGTEHPPCQDCSQAQVRRHFGGMLVHSLSARPITSSSQVAPHLDLQSCLYHSLLFSLEILHFTSSSHPTVRPSSSSPQSIPLNLHVTLTLLVGFD